MKINRMSMKKSEKKAFLKEEVKHIDIKSFDSTSIIDAMRDMSFTSRDTAVAADILNRMINDDGCTIFLTLAGSTSAGGCMQVYVDMVRNNMVDAIVATGASIVDMDFFEALGFKHYKGSPDKDDMDECFEKVHSCNSEGSFHCSAYSLHDEGQRARF